MGGNSNHVKQLLATARIYRRPELLPDVAEAVRAGEGRAGTASTELRVLCAEVAVELQQWAIAADLLHGVGASHETRLLRVRRVYCDTLVATHEAEAHGVLSEEERTQERLSGAAKVLQALAEAVEMWPESLSAVLRGIRTLWSLISPLVDAGRYADVCDAVVFLTTLHQQLRIGGGYTLVQWATRSALCLFAAERGIEAAAFTHTALESAALLSNPRLYVQLVRLAAKAVYFRERAAMSAKARAEFLGSYRARPVIYTALLTQILFSRLADAETYREELHSCYEALSGRTAELAVPVESTTTTGKGKKKQVVAKQPPPSIRAVGTFTVTDPEVAEEVKSDILLCIAMFDTLSPVQEEGIERKRHSTNRRVRSFAQYALAVQQARSSGIAQLGSCADASGLTAAHRAAFQAVAQQLVAVLKSTNAILDDGERRYTLHVGVCLLWNYLLPFLQPSLASEVQPSLDVVLDVVQADIPQLRDLFVQVGLQQCHLAYDDDNLSLLHRLLPALQVECAKGCAVAAQVTFPVQWMQHQLAILEEPSGSLTSEHERCLFAIEQARTAASPFKRIPLLKTAFQHLPPLHSESPNHGSNTSSHPHPPPPQQAHASSSAAINATAPVQCRSVVQLYKELLDLCMEDISPSLYAVASAVAEALRVLPPPAPGAAVDELEEIQATASLHSATLLWKQVEEDAAAEAVKSARGTDVAAATADGVPLPPTSAALANRENQLAVLLRDTAQRAADLEMRSAGSGSWIASNACITFLNWKTAAHGAGDYSRHMSELLELQALYASLLTKGRVQDVPLFKDLTVAAVTGLLAGFLAAKSANTVPSQTTAPRTTTTHENGHADLLRRIRACAQPESSNPQLRKAEVLCREALQLIQAPPTKWFVAMLYPCVLRLLNEKQPIAAHPQEQLLLHLGYLALPAVSAAERDSLLTAELLPLLAKDPSVRLCAWTATVATALQLEDAVLECCQLADRLYAAGRLGWDSIFVVQRGGAPGASFANGNGAGGTTPGKAATESPGSPKNPSTTGGGPLGATMRRGSTMPSLLRRESAIPVKPTPEDWEAYAQLLFMKTHVCANHLQGLSGTVRRVAVQRLFTNCVNAAIAAVHGPAAAKVHHITSAFGSYYAMLRSTEVLTMEPSCVLPSLRMLLSKALLTQVPKREWSETFAELVYQLSCVLVYISYHSGCDDDVQQLAGHLRLVRDLLPPRHQKSLKVRETTEMCYRNPSVDAFLQASRNMEADLQTRGWLIVAQNAGASDSAAEAFALALAGTQANSFAKAQCLFEYAHATLQQSLQQGSGSATQTTEQLREALRALEGLPSSAALLDDDGGDLQGGRLNATLADRSLTAVFLRSTTVTSGGLLKDNAAEGKPTKKINKRASIKKPHSTIRLPGATFQHAFLGLRIVSLLFRLTSGSGAPLATGGGAAVAKAAARRHPAPASRRDCANVMLDYVDCLWRLSARVLADAAEKAVTLPLPATAAHYYGFAEPAGAAQRLRGCIPDEELQLNTEGLWQSLLELGDYLVSTGDEAHAFAVYSWIRFAVAVSLGDAEANAECALVQRVCNLKMCVAAAAGGVMDEPYVTALAQNEHAHLPLDDGSKQDGAVAPTQAAPWVRQFLLAECELRVQLGQVDDAAALATRFLIQPSKAVSGEDAQSSTGSDDAYVDVTLGAQRILALQEATCARYETALRMLNEGLERCTSAITTLSHGAASSASVSTWAKLSSDKLSVLITSGAFREAESWAAVVRQQLEQWRTAATTAAEPSTVALTTLQTARFRVDLGETTECWASELLKCAARVRGSDAVSEAVMYATSEAAPVVPSRNAEVALLKEVVRLTGPGATATGAATPSLHRRLCHAAAQWHMRDRATSQWVAQHSAEVASHLCPRLIAVLHEIESLDQLLHLLPNRTAADTSSPSEPLPSSLGFWTASVLHWLAVDRLEANRLAGCLLSSFRRLSMTDLQLPTTNAPAHLEQAVLMFIRGASADGAPSTSNSLDNGVDGTPADRAGARWDCTLPSNTAELEQALKHHNVPVQSAVEAVSVCAVPPLLERAAALSARWPHSQLAGTVLATLAEVEVRRRAEYGISSGGAATAASNMEAESLDTQVASVLTAAWNSTPLTQAKTDKQGNRTRKSISTAKHQRSSSDASHVLAPTKLSEQDALLLQRLASGIQDAVHHLHLGIAEQLYEHLGDLFALLGRTQFAAAAAEQHQACQLVGLLLSRSVREMADCVEGRRWRQLLAVDPLLQGSTFCKELLDEAVAISPMERPLRSCAALCVDDDREDSEALPITSHSRASAVAEASAFATDAPVLTMTLSRGSSSCCVVTLRHPDGGVEGRQVHVRPDAWASLARQLDAVQRHKEELLSNPAAARLGSGAQRVTTDDAAALLSELSTAATSLLEEFQPSLQSYCAKGPLYLCLPPLLQPFAWEQTTALSAYPIVLRELGVCVMVSKNAKMMRPVKRGSVHLPKATRPNSAKGTSAAGPAICLVDVLGDHRESPEQLFNVETTKSKATQQVIVSCTSPGIPPDAAYLTWLLNSSQPGSLVVDMCGSLADALPFGHLAALRLTQLQVAVLADGAVNASSHQREERQRLSRASDEMASAGASATPRWMVQLLLLLRGAKCVVANTFPCSPLVTDALTRRCLPSLSSSKTLVDQLRGKAKDTRTPFVTLYGVLSGGAKQKA